MPPSYISQRLTYLFQLKTQSRQTLQFQSCVLQIKVSLARIQTETQREKFVELCYSKQYAVAHPAVPKDQ